MFYSLAIDHCIPWFVKVAASVGSTFFSQTLVCHQDLESHRRMPNTERLALAAIIFVKCLIYVWIWLTSEAEQRRI